MTADKYKGKRITITFPPEVYEQIAKLADNEHRTFSQTTVVLCIESLKSREEKS